jgi:glycyl-tRNA synthetase
MNSEHLDKLLETKGLDPALADEYKTVQAQADAFSPDEMGDMLKKYGVKAPDTKNDLSDPVPFNLMFATNIGPAGNTPG